MSQKEPSYSARVVRLAWGNTWALFKHKIFDTLLTAFSFAIGIPLFIRFYGTDAMTEEAFKVLAFAVFPAGLFFIFVCLWNIFLASDELVYGAIKRVSEQLRDLPPGTPQRAASSSSKPINWSIWRQRGRYTIDEFSKILAKTDPVELSIPHEAASYQKLLMEEANSGAIRARPPTTEDWSGRVISLGHSPEQSEIAKKDAVAWAEKKGFPVDHIK